MFNLRLKFLMTYGINVRLQCYVYMAGEWQQWPQWSFTGWLSCIHWLGDPFSSSDVVVQLSTYNHSKPFLLWIPSSICVYLFQTRIYDIQVASLAVLTSATVGVASLTRFTEALHSGDAQYLSGVLTVIHNGISGNQGHWALGLGVVSLPSTNESC